MKILSVVGARPNFIKIAPFINSINEYNRKTKIIGGGTVINHILVHTGQHYDDRMNDNFFTSLGIPSPDINLGIGSGTHAEQVGKTMIAFEKVLIEHNPEIVIVVGDVNATLACSITAKKQKILCCHIEAGLRSGDMNMPEEINRIVTDRISDLLLTPDLLSSNNLINEGISKDKVRFVGNIMIDTLEKNLDKSGKILIADILAKNNLSPEDQQIPDLGIHDPYAIVTMHRPSNVDRKSVLEPIIDFFVETASSKLFLIWPIHPRTIKRLKEFNLYKRILDAANVMLLYPISYHEMLRLNMDAKLMFTDSGGLQEECAILGTPCLTMRWNTERPITLQEHGGPSILVGNNVKMIKEEFDRIFYSRRSPQRPELWDGQTSKRCLDEILICLNSQK
jgi:UDP-N-acetylglucosamine 2-epimerase (non-hydrolysing)